MLKNRYTYLLIGSAFIGPTLFFIRQIAIEFRVGTTTQEHPVFLLAALIIGAGLIWFSFVPLLLRTERDTQRTPAPKMIGAAVLLGLAFRAMFFGSTPIYEDDWNRYLWDGFVVTQGISPYEYSPLNAQIGFPETPDNLKLAKLSKENGDFARRINNHELTTIYPPVAQAVFTAAALIKPLSLDALRWLYLLSEMLAMYLLIKALTLYGRSTVWVWLYALNPMIIFGAFNGGHMDILLVPFILGAILLVKNRPLLATSCLAGAAAIKLWPLILGPVLLREHRSNFMRYIGYGVFLAVLTFILCLPMLVHLDNKSSGLNAYSSGWLRSSFLFPFLQAGIAQFTEHYALLSRLLVAGLVGGTALWLGMISKPDRAKMPLAMLIVTLALYLLSPTGYPWYVIWFAFLIPFAPLYGAALLCVSTALYYVRFYYGEGGQYEIYLYRLIPLQFGLPIIILLIETVRGYRHGKA